MSDDLLDTSPRPVRLGDRDVSAEVRAGFRETHRRLRQLEEAITTMRLEGATTRDQARDAAKDLEHQRMLHDELSKRVKDNHEDHGKRIDDQAKFIRGLLVAALFAILSACGALCMAYLALMAKGS